MDVHTYISGIGRGVFRKILQKQAGAGVVPSSRLVRSGSLDEVLIKSR